MPLRTSYDPCTLLAKHIIKAVKTVEDKCASIGVVTEEEGKGLIVQPMAGKALQNLCPLASLTCWSPCGDAEYDVVNVVENSLWYVVRTGSLSFQVVGNMLGARLPYLILMFVDYNGRFHFQFV